MDVGVIFNVSFDLTHWERVSQSNPELVHINDLSLDSLL